MVSCWFEPHNHQANSPSLLKWTYSFRTKVQEYKRNPASAPLLTGLIVSLLGMSGVPLDPTIATVIVLYIVDIGIDIFCEYTEPDADDKQS